MLVCHRLVGLYGRIWPRTCVQTSLCSVCTHARPRSRFSHINGRVNYHDEAVCLENVFPGEYVDVLFII